MLRAYSADMRARVIARVESGASRREAAAASIWHESVADN